MKFSIKTVLCALAEIFCAKFKSFVKKIPKMHAVLMPEVIIGIPPPN